ncbi:AMP-binding protein [Enterovirga aerilata]|uniref:AMP-binding protein n=1 Tax=Enterovirga aerilata TaxID=2730920 RepID=A0A849I6M1_9HYPH|nr:AMP-binding protein [Enterovirga sp. DB1703]NNM72059.1 AMP-binding protein [Enterovirga sp. DB1703]
MAIVAPGRPPADRHRTGEWDASGALARLLAEAAGESPDRVAFRDGPGREIWCRRPSFELSREIATEAVRRLAAYLAGLGLDPASRVGICLPNGSEAAMSLLAVGRAGLTPCLLDVTASAGELSNAIETADMRAVITQAHLGQDRLAEKMCFVAAGFFRLRFLLAFGPDVPDGVVDLDPVLLEQRPPRALCSPVEAPAETEAGIVSFARGSGGRSALFRSYRSLIAAAAPIVAAARLRPGERLLSLLPPDDLKGLATGPVAALIAGAALEAHCAFDPARLAEALAAPEPTHLVAPAWMEPALPEIDPGAELRSIILVHEPPVQLEARPGAAGRIVDVVCCTELALLSSARSRPGEISFQALCGAEGGVTGSLVEVRLGPGDEICLRGPALARPDHTKADSLDWQPSGLGIERNGGVIVRIA